MPPVRLSWAWWPATSRMVRILLYINTGVVGGLVLAILVGMLLLGGWVMWAGQLELTLLALVLFAILFYIARGAVFEWAVRQTLADTPFYSEFYRVERHRWHALAALLGAGAHLFVYVVSPTAWFLGFIGSLVGSIASLQLASKGDLDPATPALTYNGRDIDLRSVQPIRRLSLGPWTGLWLSPPPARSRQRTPRLLSLPTPIADHLVELVEAGAFTEPGASADEASVATPSLVRAISVIAGVGFLGAAVGLGALLFTQGVGALGALIVPSILAVFGVLFLSVARYGS